MLAGLKIGKAADLRVSGGRDRRRMVDYAVQLGASGLGVAKTFIHVDTAEDGILPRPGCWSY